jgi:hypothetical protein
MGGKGCRAQKKQTNKPMLYQQQHLHRIASDENGWSPNSSNQCSNNNRTITSYFCTCTVFVSIRWDHVPCHEKVWERGGKPHAFSTSLLSGSWWLDTQTFPEKRSILDGRWEVRFTLQMLYPEERAPGTHLVGDWATTADRIFWKREKISSASR